MRVRLAVLLLAALGLWISPLRHAEAQGTGDLVQQLDSPDWRIRAEAIHALTRLPASALPPTFAPKAIALLEREAVSRDPSPARGSGEGYGEYLIDLVRGVVRLNDPRAVRGVALLGIGTSRAAQEFVAAQGPAGLPSLDEAWRNENMRQAVAETWATMLGTYTNRLSRDERLSVLGRLLRVSGDEPFAFTWAADIAGLWQAIPLLDDLAARDTLGIVRETAADVVGRLRASRTTRTSADLLSGVGDWLAALCVNAAGTRRDACESLSNLLAGAREQVRVGRRPAANTALQAFAGRADAAFRQGALSREEYTLLAGNASYVISRP